MPTSKLPGFKRPRYAVYLKTYRGSHLVGTDLVSTWQTAKDADTEAAKLNRTKAPEKDAQANKHSASKEFRHKYVRMLNASYRS